MKQLIVDGEEPVLLRMRSQDEIHNYDLGSVARSEGVEPDDTKTSERLHAGGWQHKTFFDCSRNRSGNRVRGAGGCSVHRTQSSG